jgi:hypothetical protein
MVRKWRQWPWEKKLGLATLAVTMVGAAIPLAIWAADALRAHSPGPKVSASELLVENPNRARLRGSLALSSSYTTMAIELRRSHV